MRVTNWILAGALTLAWQAAPAAAQGSPSTREALPPAAADQGRIGSLSPGEAKRAARARQRAAARATPASPDKAAASPPAAAPRHVAERPRPPAPSHVAERPATPAPVQAAERPRPAAPARVAQRPRQPAPVLPVQVRRPLATHAPTRPLVAAHRPPPVERRYAGVDDRPRFEYRRPGPRLLFGYPRRYVLEDGTVVIQRRPFRRFWRFYARYPMSPYPPYPGTIISAGAPTYVGPQRFGPPPGYSGADTVDPGDVDGQ